MLKRMVLARPNADWMRPHVCDDAADTYRWRSGFDIDAFLAAPRMDERTRVPDARQNAAMLLALMWYSRQRKRREDMVVLPYKIGWHCYQISPAIVMESLAKKRIGGELCIRDCRYGIKAQPTSIHTCTTARRRPEFFVTFVERKRSSRARFEAEDGITSGDISRDFCAGPSALYRRTGIITMSIPR